MKQHGFTLIELVVTMAVMALLALAATPSITDWLRNARLRNMTESVQTGIQQARNEAVRRNRQVSFWLVNLPTTGVMENNCTLSDGSNANGWVVSIDSPAGACAEANSLTTTPMIVARAALAQGSSGVRLTSSNADSGAAASSVTFDGLGRVVVSATTPARNMNRLVAAYGTAAESDRPLQLDVDASGGTRRCDQSIKSDDDSRACPASAEDSIDDTETTTEGT